VDTCRDLNSADRARLADYVSRKYHVPARVGLRVEHEERVGNECYKKLVFRGDGALAPFHLTLFASPDLRFLSSDLLDSSLDPVSEEREEANRLMQQLLEGEFAARGPATAPITVVVFSDFQCPYCRRMRELLASEPLLLSGDKVRLVFRHMPMSQHDWAQKASEAAACAQFQSSAAFWRLHNGLFDNQQRISKDNIDKVVEDTASGIQELNMPEFRECLARQMSLGAVIRDREIGSRAGVRGTPTLFINGVEASGIHNAVELHQLLTDALQRTTEHVAASVTVGSHE
jgi:protein-disulfide isomerase